MFVSKWFLNRELPRVKVGSALRVDSPEELSTNQCTRKWIRAHLFHHVTGTEERQPGHGESSSAHRTRLRAGPQNGTGSLPRVPDQINGGVASYLTPSVRVLCSLLVPFLRCVQLPMLSILQREQERDVRTDGAGSRPLSQTK